MKRKTTQKNSVEIKPEQSQSADCFGFLFFGFHISKEWLWSKSKSRIGNKTL
ncbi:hypothetical protein V6C21_04990 [[Clostridium] cellulosi]